MHMVWIELEDTLGSHASPIKATVRVPPLNSWPQDQYEVYTYSAIWLGLQALARMQAAESRLAQLTGLTRQHGHANRTPQPQPDSNLREQNMVRSEWAVALLELVHLFRLHKEVANHARHENNRLNTHYPRADLGSIAVTAGLHCGENFHSLVENFEQRRLREGQHPPQEPILQGSFAQCADVLMQFLHNECKLDHAGNFHNERLGSIQELTREVLEFLADKASQVLHNLVTQPLLALY